MTTPSTPSYRISLSPGKNSGLFATRLIPVGELIIAERALVVSYPFGASDAVAKLDAADQATFYGLTDSFQPEQPTPITIFRTNAFPLGPRPSPAAIFPICARINHSCLPNVHHGFDPSTGCRTIYADTDIPEGAEILTTYRDHLQTREARQADLLSAFNFMCLCTACSGPADPDSDSRRVRISLIDRVIGRTTMRDPAGDLRLIKEKLRLLDEEGLFENAERSRSHSDALQVCMAVLEVDQAKRHMGQAYAWRVLCNGVDSPAALKARRTFSDPSSHPIAGQRGRIALPAICDGCGKEEKGGFKGKKSQGGGCGECHCALYCSRSCKLAHAAGHKAVCAVLQGHK